MSTTTISIAKDDVDQRRLPVYLLIDTSLSMDGDPIEAVRQGMRNLVSELRGDPQALETAFLSVITFDSEARQVAPLADLVAFQEPNLQVSGATSLGAALRTLRACIDSEVRKNSPTQKGDYRPIVFLMTDGEPTDSWEKDADELKRARPANIIACGCGPNVNVATLKRITEIVVMMTNYNPDTFKAFFKWVSQSIKTTSTKLVATPDAGAPIDLPPPPATLQIIP